MHANAGAILCLRAVSAYTNMKTIKSERTHHLKSEAELAARKVAIEQAVEAYGSRLFNFIRVFINDYHIAEDLLQALWVSVLKDFGSEQIMQIAMLRRRAQQLIIDSFRRKVPTLEVRMDSTPESASSHKLFLEPFTDSAERHLWKVFWENFEGVQLTDNEKDAFWLKERYGYTINELSDHFKTPRSTVCDWVQKVKRECANYLSQEAS
jgi:RNA polymerase sigma factor (sigma-70 family)